MQRVLAQRFERTFRQVSVQDSWNRSKRSSYTTTGFNSMFTTTHGSQGEEPTLEKIHRVDPGTCIDSALREIYDAYKAACSVSIIKPWWRARASRTAGHDDHEATTRSRGFFLLLTRLDQCLCSKPYTHNKEFTSVPPLADWSTCRKNLRMPPRREKNRASLLRVRANTIHTRANRRDETPRPMSIRPPPKTCSLAFCSKEDVIGPCRERRHLTPTRQSPSRASP